MEYAGIIMSRTSPALAPLTDLRTADEVFEQLDEVPGVMKLLDIDNYSVVHNWKTEGAFPPKTYVAMQEALRAKGYRGHPKLWKMVGKVKAAAS